MTKLSDDEIVEEMVKLKARGEGTYSYLKNLGLSEIQITKLQTYVIMSSQSDSVAAQLAGDGNGED